VAFAGWADKYGQVLGCQNAVAGPYWNITVPQPTGVVGVVCPSAAPLLGLVAMLAPVVCSGNAAVVVSPTSAPVVCTFGEVCATSDVPGGVVNLLTGDVSELVPVLAKHRDLDGVFAAQGTDGGGLSADLVAMVREGTADNLKRVKLVPAAGVAAVDASRGTAWVEPFVEFKTVWHPVGA
jgi:acyl-CoA reductase-like NAD-dependent aldehyde dehydrogenase